MSMHNKPFQIDQNFNSSGPGACQGESDPIKPTGCTVTGQTQRHVKRCPRGVSKGLLTAPHLTSAYHPDAIFVHHPAVLNLSPLPFTAVNDTNIRSLMRARDPLKSKRA